ncbi:MAG: pyruvate dehydrogenase (acetyl-transferring) E1 component subunit alpha [Phycisphaeraceae bacterium]
MTTATRNKTKGAKDDQARPSDELANDKLLAMLYDMMLIRRFEERTMQSYMQQKVGGFCHIYSGEEACAVGSINALQDDDPVITAYRDHGHALARGMHPNYGMAELFGKITGCAKGKGGSMHFFDKPRHMYGGHAIVGGQCPLAIGLAFGIQYRGEDKVCLCYLGDGALNQGAFHEAMNMAGLWNLPIIFLVENNLYSMGTHIARGTTMAHDLSKKAESYGMRYAECDGMDALEVYDVTKREVDQTRGSFSKALGRDDTGGGPCMMQVKTYRFQGHSMSDPRKYRTKEEEEQAAERDCIQVLAKQLVERKIAKQDELDELDKKAKKAVQDAVKYADQSPNPDYDELYTDVYSQPYPPFEKGELPVMLTEEGEAE